MGSSAREHEQRAAERQRYADSQLRATRADPSQPSDQVGTTRAAHAAEHKDRAGVPRGPEITDDGSGRDAHRAERARGRGRTS